MLQVGEWWETRYGEVYHIVADLKELTDVVSISPTVLCISTTGNLKLLYPDGRLYSNNASKYDLFKKHVPVPTGDSIAELKRFHKMGGAIESYVFGEWLIDHKPGWHPEIRYRAARPFKPNDYWGKVIKDPRGNEWLVCGIDTDFKFFSLSSRDGSANRLYFNDMEGWVL